MTSITVIKPKFHDSSNPETRKLDYLYEKYLDAYHDYEYYLDKFINNGGYPKMKWKKLMKNMRDH